MSAWLFTWSNVVILAFPKRQVLCKNRDNIVKYFYFIYNVLKTYFLNNQNNTIHAFRIHGDFLPDFYVIWNAWSSAWDIDFCSDLCEIPSGFDKEKFSKPILFSSKTSYACIYSLQIRIHWDFFPDFFSFRITSE